MRWQILMVLTAGLLLAANRQQDGDAKKELQTFQGTWMLVSAERDGKKVPDEKTRLVIMGNNYSLTQESSAVIGHKGTFVLDPSKKPKETEVKVTEGADKGKSFLGIYELTSDDYKVCFAPPGKDRPKDFTSKPGSGHLLQVWKRDKK
jgi:uncharacterized protein (TIGR03067 family)